VWTQVQFTEGYGLEQIMKTILNVGIGREWDQNVDGKFRIKSKINDYWYKTDF